MGLHKIRNKIINIYGLPVEKHEKINGDLASDVIDVHGKEIYEGDFVRLVSEPDEIHQVKWERGSLTVDGVTLRNCLDGSLELVEPPKDDDE